MPTSTTQSRFRRWPRRLVAAAAVGLLACGALAVVGDFGLTQGLLNGVERRALAGQPNQADRWGLRLLYATLRLGGRAVYPQASQLLAYYCEGRGDTLRFDARPLLQHPEVQRALRLRKPGITFRHQQSAGPFYIARRTDWALYYAFDLLYIKQRPDGIVFYDNYFFQPLARRSYTRFHFGRVHCRLNDGLIHVAYPQAKPFIVYGKVPAARPVVLARN